MVVVYSMISSKFCFTSTDAQEILLYYIKNNQKIIINKEDDYQIFLKEKVKKIFLDISQSSRIYQKNLEELKKKEMKEELEKLYKKRDELNNLKNIKCEKELNEIKEIKKEIRKMNLKIKKLKAYINKEEEKIEETKEENEKKISELEKKLGIEESNKEVCSPKKIIKKNKKKKYLNKNKKNKILNKKLSFIEDVNKIIKEKKEDLEHYANSIKENFSNSLTTRNTNKIILKSKSKNIPSLKLKSPGPQNEALKLLSSDYIFDTIPTLV